MPTSTIERLACAVGRIRGPSSMLCCGYRAVNTTTTTPRATGPLQRYGLRWDLGFSTGSAVLQ